MHTLNTLYCRNLFRYLRVSSLLSFAHFPTYYIYNHIPYSLSKNRFVEKWLGEGYGKEYTKEVEGPCKNRQPENRGHVIRSDRCIRGDLCSSISHGHGTGAI